MEQVGHRTWQVDLTCQTKDLPNSTKHTHCAPRPKRCQWQGALGGSLSPEHPYDVRAPEGQHLPHQRDSTLEGHRSLVSLAPPGAQPPRGWGWCSRVLGVPEDAVCNRKATGHPVWGGSRLLHSQHRSAQSQDKDVPSWAPREPSFQRIPADPADQRPPFSPLWPLDLRFPTRLNPVERTVFGGGQGQWLSWALQGVRQHPWLLPLDARGHHPARSDHDTGGGRCTLR